MAFLDWNDKYKIGVAEMDEQHKKWLSFLNAFYDNLDKGPITDKLKTLLDEAIDYTLYHFSEEEKYMTSIHYPKLKDQQAKHAEIREKLESYRQKMNDGKLVISTTVTTEMKKWFNEHILTDDKAYGEFGKHP